MTVTALDVRLFDREAQESSLKTPAFVKKVLEGAFFPRPAAFLGGPDEG